MKQQEQIEINSKVEYKKLMTGEEKQVFIVVEIDAPKDWCMLMSDIGWGSLNPKRPANISDLKISI